MAKKQEYHVLQIGKQGITQTVIDQAKQMIQKHKVIKVKFLPTAVTEDKKKLINELVEKTGAVLKKQIGFTAILAKKK